ncbi:unnamed protein product [Arabis nemorensis]|uniref:Bax inhibitor 1 n=1 Tax=Arabis nemorensis TaxID=586526 RepID=A0A565CI50_9BRAS|nr:unnamed protein product [Arabis nemorensis]
MAEANVRVLRFASLNNFRQLSPVVKSHLKRVYISLICALAASAFGVYIHMLFNIGGFVTDLLFFQSIKWLHSTHTNQQSTNRLYVLFLSTVLKGASVGPMIKLAIDLDSSILSTAFVGTSVVFSCLSCGAMLARRREYLYLGGLLTPGLSTLSPLLFASFIYRGYGSTWLFNIELYFGLFLFAGYMPVDTQEIVEKAHNGDMDYLEHSFSSFTDFVAVFVRVLIILMLKNSAHKVEKNSMALLARLVCPVTKIVIHNMLDARNREA